MARYRKAINEEWARGGSHKAFFDECVEDGKLDIEYSIADYNYCPVPVEEIDTPADGEDP